MISGPSRKLFLIVSAFVAVVDIIFVYLNYHFSERNFRISLAAESENLNLNFNTLMDQTYSNMQTLATFVASDTQIQQLFLQGKNAVVAEGGGAGGVKADLYRKELYALVGEKWSQVQRKFGARQLHFHLGPGSTSFLRVHRPEKFGDNMDNVRFTIVDTNQQQMPRSGFETGRVYSGLRGVIPVTADDPASGQSVHVGALEVGTSFDVILNILAQQSHYSAGVLLTKEHIRSAMWPEAISRRFGTMETGCNCVIESSSDSNFKDVIAAGLEKQIRFRDGGHEQVLINDHHFLVSYFPLRDYLGTVNLQRDDVGAIVFWRNIDEQIAELRHGQLYNLLYGILGFIIVELLFLFAFRTGTRRLQRAIDAGVNEIRVNQERLETAQRIAHIGNWEWHIQSGQLWWSDQVFHIFELEPGSIEPSYQSFLDYIHPEDRQAVENAIQTCLSSSAEYAVEHRLKLPSGHPVRVLEKGHLVRDAQGEPLILKGTVQDITSLHQLEQRLSEVIWASDSGIWEWQLDAEQLQTNPRWAKMLGYSVAQLAPLSMTVWEMLIHPDDLPTFRAAFEQLRDADEHIVDLELRIRHRSGYWLWIKIRGRVVEQDLEGRPIRISGSTYDVTSRKENEFKIQRLATTDSLTGLYNRSLFNERLNEKISLYSRTGIPFGLMMLDLDGFKPVNDIYGHPAGDQLLRLIARDLKAECRDTDLVARLGGDEFAIILSATDSEQGCQVFAERLQQRIAREKVVEGNPVRVSASVGYCLYTDSHITAGELIKRADVALYQSKRQRKQALTTEQIATADA